MSDKPLVTAFLDASVLYSALLRDILMHCALRDLYRPRWSSRVNEEWMRALARNRPDLSRARIERTRDLMETYVRDARVEGYEHRVAALLLPDLDDRHVLAAAIHAGARVIITANLRDFPAEALAPFDIEAIHPDRFVADLIGDNPVVVVAAMRRIREALANPPMAGDSLLAAMRRQGLAASADALARTPEWTKS